jgi:hypothetical protein
VDLVSRSYLGTQKLRNDVANLPQQIQLGTRRNVSIVFVIAALWQGYAGRSGFFSYPVG